MKFNCSDDKLDHVVHECSLVGGLLLRFLDLRAADTVLEIELGKLVVCIMVVSP